MDIPLETRPLFDQEKLAKRAKELGEQITKDYKGKELVLVGVLKGSVPFLVDLMRHIDLGLSVEFVGVSSYEGKKSTGNVRITHDLTFDIKDKHVIIVEDIIDTGLTIDYLLELFNVRNPKSLKVCTLLSKPEAHIMKHTLDYVGFEITKEFVIGYGLDLDGKYRNLPYIAQVISD